MHPLGVALNSTGATDLIGETLIAAIGGFGPPAILAGVSILAMVLTQPMHNTAVAIIITPIGLNANELMQSDPRPFAVAVIVACSADSTPSCSSFTPTAAIKGSGSRRA